MVVSSTVIIEASITPQETIKAEVIPSSVIVGEVLLSDASKSNPYDGTYVVEPSFAQQILETKNKVMRDDVTVNAIEVARTSNPSGGTTVYIGGII